MMADLGAHRKIQKLESRINWLEAMALILLARSVGRKEPIEAEYLRERMDGKAKNSEFIKAARDMGLL